MVYGFAAAVVMRLIKPIVGLTRASIHMDDGNVVGRSAMEEEEAMQLVLECFQLVGWNIQWAKTTRKAAKVCKDLGFLVDRENFTYQATEGKLVRLELC
jgi:hypothetical protein